MRKVEDPQRLKECDEICKNDQEVLVSGKCESINDISLCICFTKKILYQNNIKNEAM